MYHFREHTRLWIKTCLRQEWSRLLPIKSNPLSGTCRSHTDILTRAPNELNYYIVLFVYFSLFSHAQISKSFCFFHCRGTLIVNKTLLIKSASQCHLFETRTHKGKTIIELININHCLLITSRLHVRRNIGYEARQ